MNGVTRCRSLSAVDRDGGRTLCTGALIAAQGYNTLSNVGIEALTGFLGAFLNVRFIAPATAGVALAATIGAGATAQLGAMRINEEIDALEVMGIRPITYLASTRIVAGVVAVIPICAAPVCGGVLPIGYQRDGRKPAEPGASSDFALVLIVVLVVENESRIDRMFCAASEYASAVLPNNCQSCRMVGILGFTASSVRERSAPRAP